MKGKTIALLSLIVAILGSANEIRATLIDLSNWLNHLPPLLAWTLVVMGILWLNKNL